VGLDETLIDGMKSVLIYLSISVSILLSAIDFDFPALPIESLFDQIRKRIPLGDALILSVAAQYLPFVSTFVTWDKAHFEEKFPGRVITPSEY